MQRSKKLGDGEGMGGGEGGRNGDLLKEKKKRDLYRVSQKKRCLCTVWSKKKHVGCSLHLDACLLPSPFIFAARTTLLSAAYLPTLKRGESRWENCLIFFTSPSHSPPPHPHTGFIQAGQIWRMGEGERKEFRGIKFSKKTQKIRYPGFFLEVSKLNGKNG